MNIEVSNLNKRRIKESLEKGKRFDSRKLEEHREIIIETGVSKNAEGSARVKFGDTEVMAGVKVGVAEPYTDHEDEGTLITTAELLPLSSARFEYGPPRIEAIELARIVDRGIRESGFIDFKKLCVREKELVWLVFIDVYAINDDGNLIDAAALAAVAALSSAVFPSIKDDKVEYGKLTKKALPVGNIPVTLTFHKIDDALILDPTTEEEDTTTSRLTIALTFKEKEEFIHALQKVGSELTEEETLKIISSAVKEGRKFYNEIKPLIKKEKK